jgi:hypothetical protein
VDMDSFSGPESQNNFTWPPSRAESKSGRAGGFGQMSLSSCSTKLVIQSRSVMLCKEPSCLCIVEDLLSLTTFVVLVVTAASQCFRKTSRSGRPDGHEALEDQ